MKQQIKVTDRMEVKQNTNLNEEGLFATRQYMKNEIVFTLSGEIYDHPTRETIYVGNETHVHDQHGMYMNHSFNATTYIDNYNVVALRDINPDDELTFDYNKNELTMACPFMSDGMMVSGERKP